MKNANWSRDLIVVDAVTVGGNTTLKVLHPVTSAVILLDAKVKFVEPGKIPQIEKGNKIRVLFENGKAYGWKKVPKGGRKK